MFIKQFSAASGAIHLPLPPPAKTHRRTSTVLQQRQRARTLTHTQRWVISAAFKADLYSVVAKLLESQTLLTPTVNKQIRDHSYTHTKTHSQIPASRLSRRSVGCLVDELFGQSSLRLQVSWPRWEGFISQDEMHKKSFTSSSSFNRWDQRGWLTCRLMHTQRCTCTKPASSYMKVLWELSRDRMKLSVCYFHFSLIVTAN